MARFGIWLSVGFLLTLCLQAFAASTVEVKAGLKSVTVEVQEYSIIARSFEYLPRRIVLRKDIPARLYLTSVDRAHDVKIGKLNIRQKVVKGEVAVINLVPKEAGTYEFSCDIYCGPGHRGMKGEIVVANGE